MSSIGPTDGPPAPLEGYSPQQLLYLQQQFANYYNQFQQDPSSANAQQLLQFMESNKGELQFLCQNFINLAPFPNPNFATLFQCVTAGLQNYNPSSPSPALFEFLGDMASWAGVGTNPGQTF